MKREKSIPIDSFEARIAKTISEVIIESVKQLPRREQNKRLQRFCDVLTEFLSSNEKTQ